MPLIDIAVIAAPAGAAQFEIASAQGPAEPSSQSAIKAVVAEFGDSIIRKDKVRFLSLFLDPDRTSWQVVNSDKVVELKRASDPSVVKAKINAGATPTAFIDTVASRAAISEETFDHVRIDADADVAAVSCDYTFKLDGRVRNTGTEHWLLVRTDQGWRITSVNWSIGTFTP